MSMSTSGASGYVVKAEAFTNLLPENLQEKFTQAITDQDTELVDEILGENAPENHPTFESSFILKDEDEADSIEKAVVYICFQHDDLFVPKVPNPQLQWLRSKGIDPKFERWTHWG